MKTARAFDTGWPAILVFGLLIFFILGLTPEGRDLADRVEIALNPARHAVTPPGPACPEVLVAGTDATDEYRISATLEPRGYNVRFAGTADAVRRILQADARRIGIVVLGNDKVQTRQLATLASTLAPSAKLIKLPAKHSSTELAAILLNAI